jgi:hypothetical protein
MQRGGGKQEREARACEGEDGGPADHKLLLQAHVRHPQLPLPLRRRQRRPGVRQALASDAGLRGPLRGIEHVLGGQHALRQHRRLGKLRHRRRVHGGCGRGLAQLGAEDAYVAVLEVLRPPDPHAHRLPQRLHPDLPRRAARACYWREAARGREARSGMEGGVDSEAESARCPV